MNAKTWKALPRNERMELLEACGSSVVRHPKEYVDAVWTKIPAHVRNRIGKVE